MDLYIDNLFKPSINKENKKRNELVKNYINMLNNSVKERNGKQVTSRELNKIYQIGGYSKYPPSNPELPILNYDAYGIQSSGSSPGQLSGSSSGSSPGQLSGSSSGQSSALLNIAPTTMTLSKIDSIRFSDTNSSPAETQGLNSSTCAGAATQCKDIPICAPSYNIPSTSTSSFLSSITDMFNFKSTPPKQETACACGGGKEIYNISFKEFNNIMDKYALFKMPKHHRIEFKNFIEYKINQ